MDRCIITNYTSDYIHSTKILNTINYTIDYKRVALTIILTVTVHVKVSVPVSVALIVNKCNSQCKGKITILINHQTTRQNTLKR